MHIIITSGPTREPIDDVRYISNHSSGCMGVALAAAAVADGYEVTLMMGPTSLTPPAGVALERFETGEDLKQLLEKHRFDFDDLVMAAAVCDYRPHRRRTGKHRSDRHEPWYLELEATDDLVADIAQSRAPHQRVIAFALEERQHLDERAREKLRHKQVDAIVANPLETMDSPTISPTWVTPDGGRMEPGHMSKEDAAIWIIHQLSTLR